MTDDRSPRVATRRTLIWAHLGRVAYAPTDALQTRLRKAILAGVGEEHVLTLEHDPPVFTLGRNASAADVTAAEAWRASRGIQVHESDRGGQVTYHGPGQLVVYPILDLRPDRCDIRRYVRDLESVIIHTLADFGVEGWIREGKEFIGVWTGDASAPRKIASIGVHLSRWITTHGFALNVATDLDCFGGIVACGLGDVAMTSIERETGERHNVRAVATRAARHVATVYHRALGIADADEVGRLRAEHAVGSEE